MGRALARSKVAHLCPRGPSHRAGAPEPTDPQQEPTEGQTAAAGGYRHGHQPSADRKEGEQGGSREVRGGATRAGLGGQGRQLQRQADGRPPHAVPTHSLTAAAPRASARCPHRGWAHALPSGRVHPCRAVPYTPQAGFAHKAAVWPATRAQTQQGCECSDESNFVTGPGFKLWQGTPRHRARGSGPGPVPAPPDLPSRATPRHRASLPESFLPGFGGGAWGWGAGVLRRPRPLHLQQTPGGKPHAPRLTSPCWPTRHPR